MLARTVYSTSRKCALTRVLARRRAPLAGLVLASAAAGCAPHIQRFEVTPDTVCAGDEPSVARWEARGDLALQVGVDDRDAGAPEVRARLQQLPPGSRIVTLRLTASRGGEERAAETRSIEQLPPSFDTEVAFPARPEEGGVVASGGKNPARWGDRFEIATVAALDGRTLEVRHAGRTVAVGADPSDGLAGTALEGSWELRWRGQGTPPEVLRLTATVRCKGRS